MGSPQKYFVFILLGLLIFGCSTDRSKERTIVIWHQMRPDEREILRIQLSRFQSLHHDTLKVVEVYKETEELRNGFVIASIAGQGPDLVYGPSDPVGIYEATRTIRPLEDLFVPEEISLFDSSGILNYKGHLYMIADKIGNHLALVYNKKYVNAPPETDTGLVNLALDIQAKFGRTANRPNVYGIAWNYTEPFFYIPFFTGFGGWIFRDDGVTPNLNTPEMIAGLNYIRALRDTYRIVPNESDYEIADALFKDGKSAMIINGDWSWAGYLNRGLDIGIAPLPLNTSTGLWAAPMTSPKGYSMNVNVTPEREGMVVSLLKFLLNEENQLETARALNTAPTLLSLYGHPDIVANEILRNSLLQIKRGKTMPVVPELRAIWDSMRPGYQAVMGGALTPEQAAEQMQRLAEKKIKDMRE